MGTYPLLKNMILESKLKSSLSTLYYVSYFCVFSGALEMLEKFHMVISWVRTRVYIIPGDDLSTCLFSQGHVCVLWPRIQVLMSDGLHLNLVPPLGGHMTLGSYLNLLSHF